MACTLILVTALLTAGPPTTARPASAAISKATLSGDRAEAARADESASLAEYNARRSRLPDTADAHWKLGLWCEQKGLKPEAIVEFTAVTRLDPGRESAWKRQGYEKHDGRWMTAGQAASERAEADAQRKADARWRPLLLKWKGWIGQGPRRAEAEAALAAVADPRAVPSIWRVFAIGSPDDQERAIDMLGHIEGERPSRALAGLAIFGKTDAVRRAAVETLTRRDHDDFLMAWIGLLHAPTKYEVRQVSGPGMPGVLLIEGERANVRRFYAPPTVEQTEALFVDVSQGRPVLPIQLNSSPPGPPAGARCVGFAGGKDLYVYDYTWALPKPPAKKAPDPTRYYQQFERFQLQAQVDRDFEFDEAAKMAAGAQAQLQHDVNAIEVANATVRETNSRLIEALRRVSGKDLGEDREAWMKWWMDRRGYAYNPPTDRPKPTVDVQVPLPYVPIAGPPVLTLGGGGGGGGNGWCMIWDHEKGQKPRTGSCFSAGTPVLTPDGPHAIETLRVGDPVLTVDGPGHPGHPGTIVALYRARASSTLGLVSNGESIITTDGHPFWKVGSGWTRAGELEPGDQVLTMNGSVRVESIEPSGPVTVWNLRVAHGSRFFVGRSGMLVHDISQPEDVETIDGSPKEVRADMSLSNPGRLRRR